MTRNKINYSHGDSGSQPADGNEFASGEKPDAQHFDWYWYNVILRINQIWDEFTRLDSDDDGVVDAADDATNVTSTYKGNDIDSDGDGTVNSAVNVTSTYKGNDIDTDGDGTVNSAVDATSTYKGNDIDSNADGRVDAADDATTVKGNDIDINGDGIVNGAENVTSTYKGNDIDSDGDGKVNAAVSADEATGFEARTTYPSNPVDGQVVFRTDKT